jgi:hypothetical protein
MRSSHDSLLTAEPTSSTRKILDNLSPLPEEQCASGLTYIAAQIKYNSPLALLAAVNSNKLNLNETIYVFDNTGSISEVVCASQNQLEQFARDEEFKEISARNSEPQPGVALPLTPLPSSTRNLSDIFPTFIKAIHEIQKNKGQESLTEEFIMKAIEKSKSSTDFANQLKMPYTTLSRMIYRNGLTYFNLRLRMSFEEMNRFPEDELLNKLESLGMLRPQLFTQQYLGSSIRPSGIPEKLISFIQEKSTNRGLNAVMIEKILSEEFRKVQGFAAKLHIENTVLIHLLATYGYMLHRNSKDIITIVKTPHNSDAAVTNAQAAEESARKRPHEGDEKSSKQRRLQEAPSSPRCV